jgi:hypothetical protein
VFNESASRTTYNIAPGENDIENKMNNDSKRKSEVREEGCSYSKTAKTTPFAKLEPGGSTSYSRWDSQIPWKVKF